MDERNLVAVSIRHTISGWKFGMPCWLWGRRTENDEKRSFSGYTQYPNVAEVYSLKEWQESGYGAGDVCPAYKRELCDCDLPTNEKVEQAIRVLRGGGVD